MTGFERELEIFRTEEEAAQQAFFAYLSVRSLAASDEDVLANMNSNPLFWRTTHHAMLMAAFMTLGRIFDEDSRSDHNIGKLMRALRVDLFTKAALRARRLSSGLKPEDADKFTQDAYELTDSDIRELRKSVAERRKLYKDRYRDVRHMVFAHKRRQEIVDAVMERTNVDEIKELLGFLAGFYEALWQLYFNGQEPVVNIRVFALPPKDRFSMSPGERVFLEGHEVLKMVAPLDPDEHRY